MPLRRALVTGLGAVTPLGHDVAGFWRELVRGNRAMRRITRFDPSGLRNENAGEVRDWSFDPVAYGLASPPDPACQFLLTAAAEALHDAGLGPDSVERSRIGATMATNFGGAVSWEQYLASVLEGEPRPDAFEAFAFDAAVDLVRQVFDVRGPMSLLSIACASGSAAIGLGLDLIRHGRADVVLCGGYDALAESPLAGLSVLRTMTPDDILPFSANRSGTLFGEGAGVMVLEEAELADARGARAYCEVLGSWQNNNAYHLTAPDPGGHGMIRVLSKAIEDAGLKPHDIDYINAHGTGTQYHDPEETHAIKTVLGDHAHEIPVSSIKGAIGHLMGAAGLVEAVATTKAIETGMVPPTMNDGAADPQMDLDFVVNRSRPAQVSCAASISAGIGGGNACVVFGRYAGGRGGQS